MNITETKEFILRPSSSRGRALTIWYSNGGGIADLRISADGEQVFSARVLSPFATILHTIAEMEETAQVAKTEHNMPKYTGCMYIARFGRTQLSTRLGLPELAEYD